MGLDPLTSARQAKRASPANAPTGGRPGDRAKTKEEAAKQFEEVLVRQFVRTMTDQLFKTQLSGEESAGWMKSQGDAQRDVLTDVLTEHLSESGALGLSDLLLRQWTSGGAAEPEAVAPQPQPRKMDVQAPHSLPTPTAPHDE